MTHDDGLTLIIGSLNLGFNPGPTPPITSVATYTGLSGNFPFQLVCGECCGGPAVLQVDLPFTNPVEVTKDWRFTNVCFKPADCPSGTSPGTPLPTDLDGDFQVQAVLKKDGTLSSYNPGQIYAVSTVTALGDLEVLEITENYADCTDDTPQILALNPAVGGGGGSVVVVIDTGDGVLTQILDANSPGVTVTNSQATVTLTDVAAGTIIRVYVKFRPGAKGQVLGLPTSCENENSAQALDEAGSPVGPEVTATAVLEVTAKP